MKIDIDAMFSGIDKQWIDVFTSSEIKPLLSSVLKSLKLCKEDSITPSPCNIFNWARKTQYSDVKVVILGQDPYPKKGDADGMSFSSKSSTIPASLRNIYKCLVMQGMIPQTPTTSDLTVWANQGVLLLNTSLTTEIGKPNAHSGIWRDFTDKLIEYISNDVMCGPCPSLTFMLWGKHAQLKKKLINEDCIVFEWLHPSPLAQTVIEADRFVNCTNFADVNNLLVNDANTAPIDWNPERLHIVFTDGACSNNGKGIFSYAGYAAYFSSGDLTNKIIYGRVPPTVVDGVIVYGTNQRGEGMGILRALEEVIKQNEITNMKSNTTVVTDSKFWKDMIECFMPSWVKKNVDFKTKKNPDLTVKLYSAVLQVKKTGSLSIIHVASHNKDETAPPEHVRGNAIADEYANKAKELKHFNMIVM